MSILRSQLGSTLVESVVAIGLASVIISAIVGMVVSAIASSTAAKSRTTATRYAEEGLEVSRLTRDKNSWTTFFANYVNASVWHVGSSNVLVTSPDTGVTSVYTREIRLTNTSSPLTNNDRVQVDVQVKWIDKGKNEVVELVSYLTKWAP